jgi:hypothetical protein
MWVSNFEIRRTLTTSGSVDQIEREWESRVGRKYHPLADASDGSEIHVP